MNSKSDTIDAEIDEILGDFDVWCRCESRECQRSVNYEQAKAKLQALLLRERKAELQDALTLFSSGEMKQHMVNRIAELSRLSEEENK